MGLFNSSVEAEDAHSPVPGTVHLVDLEGTIQAKHAKGSNRRDIVLVPAPSADPDDPVSTSKQFLAETSRSNGHTAQLVARSQELIAGMYVCLYADGRDCECCYLLRPCTYLRGDEFDTRRPKRWHRIYVLGFWLGMSLLAASRTAIWKASGVPPIDSGDLGDSSVGAIHEEQRTVDCE